MAKYKANEIMLWRVMRLDKSGRNVPARSLDHKADWLWHRLKWAWGVISGRYDVVDWEENESTDYE